jgi:hypothetical protein
MYTSDMDAAGLTCRRCAIGLLVIVLLGLTACGGSRSSLDPPGGDGRTGPQTRFAFNVRMRPQQPVEPELKTASLAVPAPLPPGQLPRRRASAAGDLLPVEATSYDPALPHALLETRGDYLLFRPVFHDPIYDSITDIAHAVYRIDTTGFSGNPTIGFEWGENGGPRRDGKFWVGLVDWAGNHWEWFEGPMDGVLTLDSLAPYVNGNGELQVMVAILYREHITVLRRLQLGAPEQRGTGVEIDDSKVSFTVPPLFIAPLPASVDLRPGCAPVNDQGTWGACTAFAVGDGAYNYELRDLYGSLGWDLSSANRRVSPKYIYLTSGELQGFPPDPSVGRYTELVASGLLQTGVCTEADAPYDYSYDFDWKPAALANAEFLKPTASYVLPARGDDGRDSIKAVLAHQGRPVYLSTQVDAGFMGYEPGTVWHYTGPSFGGHAVLIVGYDDSRSAFLVRNSWSTDWGEAGHIWVSYDTLDNPNNWYVSCGYLQDDYEDAVAQHFLGTQNSLKAPVGVAASDGTLADAIAVQWEAVPGATGYEVYRDTKSAPVTTLGPVTSWTDGNIGNDLSRVYWVRAKSGAQLSPFSASDIGFRSVTPQLTGVSPTGGSEGEQVRFTPEVIGNLPLTFSWDFGSGATPRTSDLASPLVVLGDEGSYPVNVTVTGPSGSDTFQFVLEVGENQPPSAHVPVPPGSVDAPYELSGDAREISGDSDGYIVLYEWDWENDGSWDVVTTNPLFSHTYTEFGDHTVKFRVTDDSGQSSLVTEDFTLNDPNANEPPVAVFTQQPQNFIEKGQEATFNASLSFDPDGTIVNYEWDLDGDGAYEQSGPALVEVTHTYTEDQTLVTTLRVTDNLGAQTTHGWPYVVGTGESYVGWSTHAIDPGPPAQAYRVRAAIVGGRPVVTLGTDSDQALYYYYPSSGSPGDTADWTRETIENSITVRGDVGLVDIGGQPAVAYRESSGGEVVFAQRGGTNTWFKHQVSGETPQATACAMAVINGKPGIVFDNGGLYYAQSADADPDSSLDWTVMQIGDTAQCSGNFELQELGGRAAVAFRSQTESPGSPKLAYARATVAEPATAVDWTWHYVETMDNTQNLALGLIGGLPAIAYNYTGGEHQLRVARASSLLPGGTPDWTRHTVQNATTVRPAALETIGGLPHIGYRGGPDVGYVSLASGQNAEPDAAEDWLLQEFFSRTTVFDLLSVNDKPAFILQDDDNYGLYYFGKN